MQSNHSTRTEHLVCIRLPACTGPLRLALTSLWLLPLSCPCQTSPQPLQCAPAAASCTVGYRRAAALLPYGRTRRSAVVERSRRGSETAATAATLRHSALTTVNATLTCSATWPIRRMSWDTSTTPPSNTLMAAARLSMVSISKWFVGLRERGQMGGRGRAGVEQWVSKHTQKQQSQG